MQRFLAISLLSATLIAAGSCESSAEEETHPMAASGNWIALAHSESTLAPPDVCLAVEQSGRAALRAQDGNVEFRMTNSEWSLPSGVKGTVILSIAGKDTALDIVSNTSVMVVAEMSKEQVLQMLDSMTKASSMIAKAGKDKPVTISLSGSNKVLSVFRTCAGLQGTSGGGANPF